MSQGLFEPVIGLEIHVELKTKSKMFCGCSADYFGHVPNTHCCPVCLGLPGALPVPNRKAVEWCVMLGMALNCEIPEFSKFDRKNYYYPDLPKGYQISQYDKPFAVNGWLDIAGTKEKKRIRIRRVHMEEDTGKLLHETVDGEKCTLIDFNRSGVPLVEIVTEPDITGSEEARLFLKKLYQVIKYLGISNADMEKGSMRLEPNISVRIKNQESRIKDNTLPKYKVEVKNINSFNFAKKAIDYEIERQIEILKKDEIPKQETRGWDEKKNVTYSQRSKEEAHDYRYFPEPDIPPVRWTGNQISKIKDQICELPDKKLDRFLKDYGLSTYDAAILTETVEVADYFEKSVIESKQSKNQKITPKTIANWIINKKADISKKSPCDLITMISAQQLAVNVSDDIIMTEVNHVLEEHKKAVDDYKSGKTNVIMFLVGMVLRHLKGKGDAGKVRKILEDKLK